MDNQSHQLGTDFSNCHFPRQPLGALKCGVVLLGCKLERGYMFCEELCEAANAEVESDLGTFTKFTVVNKIPFLQHLV